MEYDFCGWATKNNVPCTDGVTILQNAFEGNNGATVPLIWMHDHSDPTNVLGHVDLENREEGVYAYGYFNDTPKALDVKTQIEHGDITSMSIFAGRIKKNGRFVTHGDIKEVSLVLAGANPEARIENVIRHEDGDFEEEECDLFLSMCEGIGYLEHSDDTEDTDNNEEETDNPETIEHADDETVEDIIKTMNEKQWNVVKYLMVEAANAAKAETSVAHSDDENSEEEEETDESIEHADGKTVEDVVNTMNNDQKKVMYFLIGKAAEEAKNGGKNDMEVRHNVFETEDGTYEAAPISHAAQGEILGRAKESSCGSFKAALREYLNSHDEYKDIISHGFEDITQLFPDWHDMMTGAPEAIPEEDMAWVAAVNRGVQKSPFNRIRTRQADITAITAQGYPEKATKKKDIGNIKLVTRTTDPQTIYIKETLDRDDIIDITDFDVVAYEQNIMRHRMLELIARSILIGDGVDEGSRDKVKEEHIRSIWHDDELYTIHHVVDFAKAKKEMNGTGTGVSFGENYIRTEAFIEAALYSREKYKGRGKPAMFIDPHTINTMLMAKDMNGRRIYNTVSELTAALNVSAIHTVEEFAGKTRQDHEQTKKLLAIFVNMSDYVVGSTRRGELTSFEDFDIDFNQKKFMMETRLCGALERVKSAIVLEEDVTV